MIIAQLWSDWEIQLYVLLSFVLQIFLFFMGGLRRCNGHKMLFRFPIWLAYLLADLVAVYALGYLSRHVTTTNRVDEWQALRGQTHQLTFFWAPFLLIHLGGQDTVTAFSIEDNELWLRHLLNLLAQIWLALYTFWKSTPVGDSRLVVPAVLVFVTGIIKYGERTWALKSGSDNALRISTAGTLPGTILRFASFISMIAAFVLFVVTMVNSTKHGGGTYSRADVAITYVLFIGALCLEVCAMFSVMVSPRTWAFLEGRQHNMLARVVWWCARLQTRPWWSNSMGQYNFLSSCIPSKRRGFCSTVITKVMDLLGAKQLWSNIQNSRHAEVKTELKDTISTFLGDLQPSSRVPFHALPTSLSSCPSFREIIRNDFVQALLILHVFTDLFLHKAMPMRMIAEDREAQDIMEACKGISDYMFYLLAVHPAMLPVGSNVQDLLAEAMESVKASSSASSNEQFLSALAESDGSASETDALRLAGKLFQEAKGLLLLQEQDVVSALREVVSMWVPLLVYAAGKSPAKEHARRLSMGGELLTFVWLLMVHRMLGDFGGELDLWARDPAEPIVVRPDIVSIRGFLFEFPMND